MVWNGPGWLPVTRSKNEDKSCLIQKKRNPRSVSPKSVKAARIVPRAKAVAAVVPVAAVVRALKIVPVAVAETADVDPVVIVAVLAVIVVDVAPVAVATAAAMVPLPTWISKSSLPIRSISITRLTSW